MRVNESYKLSDGNEILLGQGLHPSYWIVSKWDAELELLSEEIFNSYEEAKAYFERCRQ